MGGPAPIDVTRHARRQRDLSGDYPYTELGAPTNADVVREMARLAKAMGREVATPDDTREMLGMG